jgi:outer membrane protein assembly factor BamB
VYVGSFDDNLYAFPASCGTGNATCTPLWHFATNGFVQSSPSVANGVAYIGSDDHDLYAFDLAAGPLVPTRPRPADLRPDRGLQPRR